ncbi:conserved hypothetical protein [delta proteobacterium NaphS2]|nr:conserved hypothetical protein [delta proteobacterium NaphS2]
MSSLEKNNHDVDAYDRLYSKKELLEEAGIPGRTLTNLIFEGVLPKPVLYQGKGGKSFFSKRQIQEASVIKRLNSDYKLSLTKIKAAKKRIAEDLLGEWPYNDECYLTVFDTIFYLGIAESAIETIEAFIDGRKTLVSQPRNTYRFIETVHHSKKYVNIDGQIRKILYDHEFEKSEFFKIEEIARCFEALAKVIWDVHVDLRKPIGKRIDNKFIPDPKKWEHKPQQIIDLVENEIMYAPPYFYDGVCYFHQNDISIVANNLLKLCHDMGYGINGGRKLKNRIQEDIESFFSFPDDAIDHSPESILFYKSINLFEDCIMWLFYYDETSYECGLYGLDPTNQKKIPSLKKFIDYYLDGLTYVSKNALGDSTLFKVKPLNMMNHKQLSKALKIGLFTDKEIMSHLEKRIRLNELELLALKKFQDLLKGPGLK